MITMLAKLGYINNGPEGNSIAIRSLRQYSFVARPYVKKVVVPTAEAPPTPPAQKKPAYHDIRKWFTPVKRDREDHV